MKKKLFASLLAATLAFGAVVSVGLVRNGSKVVRAAGETVEDKITSISDFTNAPSSYMTDGTEYEYVSTAPGNVSGVTYSATGISTNSGGTIRGNKSGLSNFNFRNKTTYDGYYVSKVELVVSGGSLATASGRSELYLKSTEMAMDANAPSEANLIVGDLSNANKTLTWKNADDLHLGYLMIYSLKTSGTAKLESLTITWSPLPDPNAPAVTINEGTQNLKVGDNVTLTASLTNVETATVVWSIENEEIATINSETGEVVAVKPGSTVVTATITVDGVEYKDTVIINVLYSEPEPIVIGVADILNTEADPTVLYRVTGKIAALGQGETGADKYGNIHITDLKDPSAKILVYGSTFTETALVFNGQTGEYKFTNPQDFLTNEQSSALKVGDVVELLVFRLDYNTTKELNGIFTKVYTDEELVDMFVSEYMHTEVAYGEVGTGLCVTEGWYTTAKAAFNLLEDSQRSLFTTAEKYAEPYARLLAWATANGDKLNENNELVTASIRTNYILNETNSLITLALVAAIASGIIITLVVLSKKRAKQR